MPNKLLEADFLTTNLQNILSKTNNRASDSTAKGAKSKVSNNPPKVGTGTNATITNRSASFNWKKELETRLADNKKLSPEAQQTEFEIENEFWTEFFTWLFKDELVVKRLLELEQLKKDIKILGFSKKTNPLLSFLSQTYVKNNLIAPGLIADETYKVIHNMIAKHLVADSELLKANDYNIIYCRDLYRPGRSATDMEKYLKLQLKILPVDVSAYSESRLERNRKVFLQQGCTSMTKSNAKLTDIQTIHKLGIFADEDKTKEKDDDSKSTDGEVSAQLKEKNATAIKSLKTKAQKLAALQYISIMTNNEKAKKALKSGNFEGSAKDIAAATAEVAALLKQIKITGKAADQVDSLVDYLINYLDN